jgi:kumamolisin
MPNDRSTSGLTAAQAAAAYHFPPARGRGQRIAVIELGGGYHDEDLMVCFAGLDPPPLVTPVPVPGSKGRSGGKNAPLDPSAIGQMVDALGEPGATFDAVRARVGGTLFADFFATLEVSLDVQLAGSLAPAAAIDVYFATNDADGLATALALALETDPTVISMSWGWSESSWLDRFGQEGVQRVDAALAAARHHDVTVCCSSGDRGVTDWVLPKDRMAGVHFPASSPHALACGGTSLRLERGKVVGEVAWQSTAFGASRASGGGTSGLFSRPAHQAGLVVPETKGVWRGPGATAGFDGRWLPDVAAHADRDPGYEVVIGGVRFPADGTSAATPLWAALLACLSEAAGQRIGWINERLYATGGAGCRDIVDGTNAMPGITTAFTAGPGWDACTGWGSPNGKALLAALTA